MSNRNPVVVRLEPADEWMHENTGESNYNESVYLNFFDAGQRFGFDGLGLRDHSGGPRFWQNPTGYRWLTANFDEDLGLGEGLSEYLDQIA